LPYRQRLFILGMIALLLFAGTGAAAAQTTLNGELCQVGADEVISGDVFVLCGELIVEGRVEGSVLGAARTATISGEVTGSLYLAGVELQVAGRVGKDVHFAGLSLAIQPGVDFEHSRGSVLSLNLSTDIASGATVPGNISSLGYQLLLDGDTGGQVNFWGSSLTISGDVGGDINATVGDSEATGAASPIETLLIPFRLELELMDPGLVVARRASIDGQLDYTGPTPGLIDAQLEQPAIYRPSETPLAGVPTEPTAQDIQRYLRRVWREFSSLAFIGVIFLFLFPRQMQSPLRSMSMRPISTLGVGLLSFIMSFPLVLIFALLSGLLMLLISVLPLENFVIFGGVVLGLANIGLASVFYFMAIYIARVVFALAIGRFILRRILRRDDGTLRAVFFSLGLGLLALSIVTSIPIVGWGFNALALFLGLGAILAVLRAQMKRFMAASNSGPAPPPARYTTQTLPRLPYFPEDARRFAPPIIDDPPQTPGTENLPQGFDWWGDDDRD